MARGGRSERREPRFERDDEDERTGGRRRSGEGRAGGRDRSKASRRRRRSLAGGLLRAGVVLGIWGGVAGGAVIAYEASKLPPIDQLSVPKRAPNIAILASDGTLLANRGETGGAAVPIGALPTYVPKAFIAIEDRRFAAHFGIDPFGIARALFSNLVRHRPTQGGSTLTQQLAKNLFLTQERTASRKIQEAILALWLEHKYTKDQILELYLNRVYFGSGAFGIEAAAQQVLQRRRACSQRAASGDAGRTDEGADQARAQPQPRSRASRARRRWSPRCRTSASSRRAKRSWRSPIPPTWYARREPARPTTPPTTSMDTLDDTIGAVDDDIVVQTTIDRALQADAEQALTEELDRKGGKFGVSQGALVAMEPDGAIKALIGGRDYAQSQFDRATAAKRQPGSSFKPFVYLAGIERGMTPDTVRDDAPINVRGWRPENYSAASTSGPVTLTRALSLSLNTVAVRLCLEAGPAAVVGVAHRLGIASDLQPNASIALGTSEVTPLEMVTAYVPFANGGIGVQSHIIRRVRTAGGRQLYQRRAGNNGRVIEPRAVAMMNTMMTETLLSGTARKGEIPGWQAAGKTGTSQDWRDAWFIGYTGRLVTGVWLGNDDASPTKKASGGTLPVAIWSRFMREAMAGQTPMPLPLGTLHDAPTASQPPMMQPGATQTTAHRNDAYDYLHPTAAEVPSSQHRGPSQPARSLLDRMFGTVL